MLHNDLLETVEHLDLDVITDQRKSVLQPLVDYIQTKVSEGLEIRLNFICTHNSRRSHLAQLWARVAAYWFDIGFVSCYSGGTEATTLYTMVKDTLEIQGFEIITLAEGSNPIYAIKHDEDMDAMITFSKIYDHPFNPREGFAAIMTCTDADQNCPVISGVEKRIAISYTDPKMSDGTPEQQQVYANKSLEIASEMFYVFGQIEI